MKKLEKSLLDKNIPKEHIDIFLQWLNSLTDNEKQRILPEHLASKHPNLQEKARFLIYQAVHSKILKTNYEIYCPDCKELVNTVHSALNIPEKLICSKYHTFVPEDNLEDIIVSFAFIQNN